jgi:hypothetical protein
MEFLGYRRPPENAAALVDRYVEARSRQIEGTDQAVVPATQDGTAAAATPAQP